MLEELLRFNRLGTADDILFILFRGLDPNKGQKYESLRRYTSLNRYHSASTLDNTLTLLRFISFVEIDSGIVSINSSVFHPNSFELEHYFKCDHFFNYLFESLLASGILFDLFRENNVKLHLEGITFVLRANYIPHRYLAIKNLLISTGFLKPNNQFENELLVSEQFIKLFENEIILPIEKQTLDKRRKLAQSELLKKLNKQTESGLEAEMWVLNYEYKRLQHHPKANKIQRISEDFVNAGYDIESFNDVDSIITDRFIEVKSFNQILSFYWSDNEVEIAREMKGNYFLYLVDRSKCSNLDYNPIIIQDPCKWILNNELWRQEASGWKFTYL